MVYISFSAQPAGGAGLALRLRCMPASQQYRGFWQHNEFRE